MFSCQFCETFKNTIFTQHLGPSASVFMEHMIKRKGTVMQIEKALINDRLRVSKLP